MILRGFDEVLRPLRVSLEVLEPPCWQRRPFPRKRQVSACTEVTVPNNSHEFLLILRNSWECCGIRSNSYVDGLAAPGFFELPVTASGLQRAHQRRNY